MRFDGKTYEADQDRRRLSNQLFRVLALMRDGEWRTLAQISAATGASEAGASARLRDLRKKRFGKRVVLRHRLFGGLFVYRMRAGKSRKPGKWKREASCRECGTTLLWFQIIRTKKHPKSKLCQACAKRL